MAASYALPMVIVMPIPFGPTKLELEVAGLYVPAPVTCFLYVSTSSFHAPSKLP